MMIFEIIFYKVFFWNDLKIKWWFMDVFGENIYLSIFGLCIFYEYNI